MENRGREEMNKRRAKKILKRGCKEISVYITGQKIMIPNKKHDPDYDEQLMSLAYDWVTLTEEMTSLPPNVPFYGKLTFIDAFEKIYNENFDDCAVRGSLLKIFERPDYDCGGDGGCACHIIPPCSSCKYLKFEEKEK